MTQWDKGYWYGITVLTVSIILFVRPELLAKPLHRAANWLEARPQYRLVERYEPKVITSDETVTRAHSRS